MTTTIADLTRIDQRADAAQETYSRRADAITSDPDLNEQAKSRQLAEAFENARNQLDRLLAERDAARDSIRKSTLRELHGYNAFTSSSEQMNRRDADERAARQETQQAALEALESADLTGDSTFARSLALAGLKRGWPAVVERYGSSHPGTGPKLELLAALDLEQESGLYGMRYALARRSG